MADHQVSKTDRGVEFELTGFDLVHESSTALGVAMADADALDLAAQLVHTIDPTGERFFDHMKALRSTTTGPEGG